MKKMLEFRPKELKYNFEPGKRSSCSIDLVNISDEYIAFKVETFPERYSVQPVVGVIQPKLACEMTVYLEAGVHVPSATQCKFMIQRLAVSSETSVEAITSMFTQGSAKEIEEQKMEVILTGDQGLDNLFISDDAGRVNFNQDGFIQRGLRGDECLDRFLSTSDEEDMMMDLNLPGFDIKYALSSGSQRSVYKATDSVTGEKVAIKMIDIDGGILTDRVMRELLLNDLNHKNIIRLKSVFLHENKLCLVMEYIASDLDSYMTLFKDIATAKKILKEILEGVSFLHAQNVIHRDLKPANILVEEVYGERKSLKVKIGDFEFARAFVTPEIQLSPRVVTAGYKAPELLLGSLQYTSAIDMWSVGCIFAEMLEKKPIFQPKTNLRDIFRLVGTPTEETWPGVTSLPGYDSTISASDPEPPTDPDYDFSYLGPAGLDLLSKLLCLDPSKRITAQAALEHGYLADVTEASKLVHEGM